MYSEKVIKNGLACVCWIRRFTREYESYCFGMRICVILLVEKSHLRCCREQCDFSAIVCALSWTIIDSRLWIISLELQNLCDIMSSPFTISHSHRNQFNGKPFSVFPFNFPAADFNLFDDNSVLRSAPLDFTRQCETLFKISQLSSWDTLMILKYKYFLLSRISRMVTEDWVCMTSNRDDEMKWMKNSISFSPSAHSVCRYLACLSLLRVRILLCLSHSMIFLFQYTHEENA